MLILFSQGLSVRVTVVRVGSSISLAPGETTSLSDIASYEASSNGVAAPSTIATAV